MAEANPKAATTPTVPMDEDAKFAHPVFAHDVTEQVREKELIESSIAAKHDELKALQELRREGAGLFTPRAALARTPPQSFSPAPPNLMDEPLPLSQVGEKRFLASPEEVQEAIRRRIAKRREVQPIHCAIDPLLNTPPVLQPLAQPEDPEKMSDQVDPLATASVEVLAGLFTGSAKGIMEAVRSKTSKLNKDEVAAIGAFTERMSAVVTHLTLRLAVAESRAQQQQAWIGTGERAPPTATYASKLKLARNADPVRIRATPGPVLAFYPAAENEALKTAEETKAELKKCVDPAKLWVQVAKVRKVGNAGVLVQTTSDESATRLRAAMPPTLRVTEPKRKLPLVCLNRLDGDPSFEEVIRDLHEQNFKEDENWPLSRIQKEATGAFKKNRSRGSAQATAVVFSCTAEFREALLAKGRVYIGWQAIEATDYVDVTCCNKCQQYGHPERSCRSADVTCSRCGATGHRGENCTSSSMCCATCKRFGRKDAASHRTASRECPARAYAIERSVAMTHYV